MQRGLDERQRALGVQEMRSPTDPAGWFFPLMAAPSRWASRSPLPAVTTKAGRVRRACGSAGSSTDIRAAMPHRRTPRPRPPAGSAYRRERSDMGCQLPCLPPLRTAHLRRRGRLLASDKGICILSASEGLKGARGFYVQGERLTMLRRILLLASEG